MTSSTDQTKDRVPFACVGCGRSLPLIITHDPDAESLECAGCGECYLGKVWPEVPDLMRGALRRRPKPTES